MSNTPTNVTADFSVAGQVKLAWSVTSPEEHLVGFYISASIEGGAWHPIQYVNDPNARSTTVKIPVTKNTPVEIHVWDDTKDQVAVVKGTVKAEGSVEPVEPPPPPPPPPPVEEPTGSVLWEGKTFAGTASPPTGFTSWANQEASQSLSNLPNSAISIITPSSSALSDREVAAKFAGQSAYKFHTEPNDIRCELLEAPFSHGETFPWAWKGEHRDFWIALQALYPGGPNPGEGGVWGNYPMDDPRCSNAGTIQFHGYGGSGGVPFGLSVGAFEGGSEAVPGPGGIHGPASNGEKNYGFMQAWREGGEVKCVSKEIWRNTVHNILLHMVLDQQSGGCEVFVNGKKGYEYHGPFGYKSSPSENPTFMHIGMYPSRTREHSEAFTLYIGTKMCFASTRAKAESITFH